VSSVLLESRCIVSLPPRSRIIAEFFTVCVAALLFIGGGWGGVNDNKEMLLNRGG